MSTMYYGGTIITMEGEHDTVEAVLTRDGKIHSFANLKLTPLGPKR